MVKLLKRFSVGERVFAKVRGYPPWPAKIQSVVDPNTKNAKYHVIFFGTKEIGTCKVDDLFQYAENKEKFSKGARRKFFQEGLQELEEDLKNDPGADHLMITEASENVPENITSDISEKDSGSVSTGDTDNLIIDESEKKKNFKRKSQIIPNTPEVNDVKKKRGRKSLDSSIVKQEVIQTKNDSAQESQDEEMEKKNVSRSGRKIKPKRFHDSLDAEISIDSSKNDVTIRNRTKSKAEEENHESPVAPIKKRTFDEREDKKSKEETDIQLQFRLNILKTEEQLVFLDTQIRSSLGLEHANTDDCLEAMNQLLEAPFTALMLKKQPQTVETIKRLRRYVGNLNDWKLTEEQVAVFKEKADQIKKKAEQIYEKFKSLFTIPEGKTFWNYFSQEVVRLKEITKDLTMEEFFALLIDPTESENMITNASKIKQEAVQASVTNATGNNKNDANDTTAVGADSSAETETAGESTAKTETSESNMS